MTWERCEKGWEPEAEATLLSLSRSVQADLLSAIDRYANHGQGDAAAWGPVGPVHFGALTAEGFQITFTVSRRKDGRLEMLVSSIDPEPADENA